MSISSVGQGPVTPTNTTSQQIQGDKPQQTQPASNYTQSNNSAKTTGAQPLNTSGRGQVVNLVV